jgi:putative phosphoesterase
MLPPAVTVAIVSDTHGHLDERIAAEVSACDYAVHAGDIGSAAVLRALLPRQRRVLAVRGNNDIPDKWPGEAEQLDVLPLEWRLQLPGGELVVVHGHQYAGPAGARHRWLRQTYPEARLIVYGHSHRRVRDLSGTPWVVNPGAAGRVRTCGGPSCIVLTAGPRSWELQEKHFSPPAAGRGR